MKKPAIMKEYDLDGNENRLVVINCALYDIRVSNPKANVVEVGQVVDEYLAYWDTKRHQPPTPI